MSYTLKVIDLHFQIILFHALKQVRVDDASFADSWEFLSRHFYIPFLYLLRQFIHFLSVNWKDGTQSIESICVKVVVCEVNSNDSLILYNWFS